MIGTKTGLCFLIFSTSKIPATVKIGYEVVQVKPYIKKNSALEINAKNDILHYDAMIRMLKKSLVVNVLEFKAPSVRLCSMQQPEVD